MGGYSLTWNGDRAVAAVEGAVQAGLRDASEYVRGEAQQQAPIDTGILRGSAAAQLVGTMRAAISFNTPYAVRQHEELSYRHPRGGKAKYLEDPLVDGKETVRALIAATVSRALQ